MYVISWWEFKVVTRSSQSRKIHLRNGDSQENETIARPSHNGCIHIQIIPWSRNCYGEDGSTGFFSFFSFSWQSPTEGMTAHVSSCINYRTYPILDYCPVNRKRGCSLRIMGVELLGKELWKPWTQMHNFMKSRGSDIWWILSVDNQISGVLCP